ncbi:hypothetical protein ACWDBW_46490 [Streptomyces sp. NPDC001107]
MKAKCTVFGAVSAAVVLALAPGAAAVAGVPSTTPSPLPTQAYATIEAEKQINVGSVAQSTGVNWMFGDDGAQVPVPTHDTLVIDTRDLAGIASVAVDDPRCKADRQVITCVNAGSTQSRSVLFTVRADAGAKLGESGTIKYTLTARHATGVTARTKVVAGTPKLVVGKVPDVSHARIGSRIALPLQLRNTGDLATDRRIMVQWESEGGLAFDRKFSNCTYGGGGDAVEPGGHASVTCIFKASLPAGATVELSSPLTALVGKRFLSAVTDYSVTLIRPDVKPGGGSERGTGPALTLVPASGSGSGFETGANGQFTVSADNFADLAATATATAKPGRHAGEWTLDLNAVNHGPASVYSTVRKAVALVDVVLPKGTVATGNAFEEGEDSPYGQCLLWVSNTGTAPFEAGHRHYVCPVPFGVAAGKDQFFELWVKTERGYDGAKGTATVRPGPAGLALHDPDASNDRATFTFGTSATSTQAAPSGGTPAAAGRDRAPLIASAAGCAALLGGAALVVHRRKRASTPMR